MAQAKLNYGYFVLLSDEIKDAVTALEVYRNKDSVEKAFRNHTLQELLDILDIIECFEVPAQKLQVGEATKHKLELYAKLGV